MSEEKTLGVYTPIYEGALDKLYDLEYLDRARHAERVFRAYARHADSVGTCFPSVRRIMEVCRCSETTVRRALTILFKHDYIRAHIEKSRARRREQTTFQVSPFVLHIAPASRPEALELWKIGLSHCNVIFNEQPATESESESRIKTRNRNQLQNQQQQQNAHSPENGINYTIARNAPKTAQKQAEGQNAHSPTQKQSVSIKNSAERQQQAEGLEQLDSETEKDEYVPPRREVPIEQCKRPLMDRELEEYAQRIKAEGGTAMAQARQLVASYPIPEVKAALEMVDRERAAGNKIRNRIGFARSMLRKGAVCPEDEQIIVQNLSGKYADYFDN